MPITYDQLMSIKSTDSYSYTERDCMLYAYAIGMGRDPFDQVELDYVYERRGTLRGLVGCRQAVGQAGEHLPEQVDQAQQEGIAQDKHSIGISFQGFFLYFIYIKHRPIFLGLGRKLSLYLPQHECGHLARWH